MKIKSILAMITTLALLIFASVLFGVPIASAFDASPSFTVTVTACVLGFTAVALNSINDGKLSFASPIVYTFTNNTYAGEELAGYMAKSLLGGNGSVERGLLTVLDNVKKRKILRDVDDDIEFQTPSARFVGQTSPDRNITENYIDPVGYEVMKEVNMKDLINSWESQALKPGSLNDYEGTVELNNFLMERQLAKINIMNERLYWLGKANAGYKNSTISFAAAYPGLLPRMEASPDTFKLKCNIGELTLSGITTATPGVVTVSSTATLRTGDQVTLVGTNGNQQFGGVTIEGKTFTITVLSATTFSLGVQITGSTAATSGKVQFINTSNCLEVLTSIYSQILDELRDVEDRKLMVGNNVMRAYAFAQAAVANGAGSYFIGKKEMDFLGEMLTPMNHWQGNTIVYARSSNLFLGVDLLSDESNVEAVDMRTTTLDQTIRYKASMKSDTNFKFGSEILFFRPSA